MILGHDSKTNERLRAIARNMGFVCDDLERVKTFIHNYTNIAKTTNWEIMSMSTALGAAPLDASFYGCCFDGRYVYHTPYASDTILRFDTTQLFTTAAAWEKMTMSTALGVATVEGGFCDSCFDGRYIYFGASAAFTMMRYDISKSFTDAAAWEKCSISTAQGANPSGTTYLFNGLTFDGRYVYLVPFVGLTLVRYDTKQSFSAAAAWERMNLSTACASSVPTYSFSGAIFDGRYIYMTPYGSTKFLRYDSTLAFTNSSAWERINVSTAMASSVATNTFMGIVYDGRYVYYTPSSSDTFVRFDTTKVFTNSSSWEKMNISTVVGSSASSSFYSGLFDGRYVYFSAWDYSYARYDSLKPFSNSSSWETMTQTTAQGGSSTFSISYASFDGKYVYFSAVTGDTYTRVLACPNKDMRDI